MSQPETERPSPGTNVGRHLIWVSALLVLVSVLAWNARHTLAILASPQTRPLLDAALAAAWVGAGAALIGRGRAALATARDRSAPDTRRGWHLALNLFAAAAYAYLFVVALGLLHIDVGSLLVGGAVTGVLLGIAAQGALGNVFGGLVLLLLHPYTIGERVTLRSSQFGGAEYSGTVAEVTLFYTGLDTSGGRVWIPNATCASAVVRVEGRAGAETSFAIPVPYAISPETLRTHLVAAGLGPEFQVEGFTEANYTIRVRGGADAAHQVAVFAASLHAPASRSLTDAVHKKGRM